VCATCYLAYIKVVISSVKTFFKVSGITAAAVAQMYTFNY